MGHNLHKNHSPSLFASRCTCLPNTLLDLLHLYVVLCKMGNLYIVHRFLLFDDIHKIHDYKRVCLPKV
jgi:hypothetical protein